MLRVAKEDGTYAETRGYYHPEQVINWQVILTPPDLVAASIKRDDVHTGVYGKYSSLQSKSQWNFTVDACV